MTDPTPKAVAALAKRLSLRGDDDGQDAADMLEALQRRAEAAEAVVAAQAEDDGLWFQAQTAPEAYLQQELRRLHAVIEGKSPEQCAREVLGGGRPQEDGDCEHEWVSMTNQAIESGEMCIKCNRIRP